MKFKLEDAFQPVTIKLESKKEVKHLLDVIHTSTIKSGLMDDLSLFLTDVLDK